MNLTMSKDSDGIYSSGYKKIHDDGYVACNTYMKESNGSAYVKFKCKGDADQGSYSGYKIQLKFFKGSSSKYTLKVYEMNGDTVVDSGWINVGDANGKTDYSFGIDCYLQWDDKTWHSNTTCKDRSSSSAKYIHTLEFTINWYTAPSNLTISEVADSATGSQLAFKVDFTTGSDTITTKKIELATDSNFTNIVTTKNPSTIKTTHTFTGLTMNTGYYARVTISDGKTTLTEKTGLIYTYGTSCSITAGSIASRMCTVVSSVGSRGGSITCLLTYTNYSNNAESITYNVAIGGAQITNGKANTVIKIECSIKNSDGTAMSGTTTTATYTFATFTGSIGNVIYTADTSNTGRYSLSCSITSKIGSATKNVETSNNGSNVFFSSYSVKLNNSTVIASSISTNTVKASNCIAAQSYTVSCKISDGGNTVTLTKTGVAPIPKTRIFHDGSYKNAIPYIYTGESTTGCKNGWRPAISMVVKENNGKFISTST